MDYSIQQLREAFPFNTAADYFIFDRDTIFSAIDELNKLNVTDV